MEGYYDRTFKYLKKNNNKYISVGYAFDGQKVSELPKDKFDIKLDYVITEKNLLFYMKILFIGDIVGKSAREKVKESIANLKTKYDYDVLVANAENATGGYGISKKDAGKDLLSSGLDAITLGNHAWDQREMLNCIEECPKIIRAINYPQGVPGKGFLKLN